MVSEFSNSEIANESNNDDHWFCGNITCSTHSEYTARNDVNYQLHVSNYMGVYINNDTANTGTSSLILVMSFLFI